MEKKIVQLTDVKNELSPLPITVSDAVYLTNIQPLKEASGNLPAGSDINGLTLTQFLNRAYCKEGRLSFLHISDTHKYNYGITKCKELMEQDLSFEFTLLTGDLQITNEMKNTIQSTSRPFLALLGNHDVADDFANNQLAARNTYITPLSEKYVKMGSKTASYWYKDVIAQGATLRIIAFDEYEYTDVGLPAAGKYSVVYSEAQIRWFIELLKNTPSNYYLVLAHHQPVSALRNADSTGLFTSEKAPNIYEHEGIKWTIPENACIPTFIPMIVDAYLNKTSISGSYKCGNVSGTTMNLNTDFSNITPAKFLFHIGGHTHWDVCEYLPLYPKQLQLIIDQDRSEKYTYSDLARNAADESAYCINKVTLDFDNQKTIIERIGAHLTDSGTDRNRIEFHFDKVD